ncbi:polysaccharide deacetylase family protein [Anaerotignum sp.]|uniref:polysaccharide deacetylase family protein n=1 Tax=Anaerotignum sp. TaxID=2039241 RepID=UPI0028A9D27C|nr:polysaccharide deacetylase family protein [Anaerotignum sp.]
MSLKRIIKKCLSISLFAALLYFLVGVVTTLWYRAMNPLKRLTQDSKKLYLTFDDGMNPVYTPMLLDLLKKTDVKASFFILASTAKSNPKLLQRMIEEGHQVGLHSFKHNNQILQFPHQLKLDFEKSMRIFDERKIEIKYFRPPWGHVRPLGLCLCKAYGLRIVLWNVIVQDWEGRTTAKILCDKLRKKVRGNSVICLHDGRGKNKAPLKTIEALSIMIPKWKEEGYAFETVDNLYKKNIK